MDIGEQILLEYTASQDLFHIVSNLVRSGELSTSGAKDAVYTLTTHFENELKDLITAKTKRGGETCLEPNEATYFTNAFMLEYIDRSAFDNKFTLLRTIYSTYATPVTSSIILKAITKFSNLNISKNKIYSFKILIKSMCNSTPANDIQDALIDFVYRHPKIPEVAGIIGACKKFDKLPHIDFIDFLLKHHPLTVVAKCILFFWKSKTKQISEYLIHKLDSTASKLTKDELLVTINTFLQPEIWTEKINILHLLEIATLNGIWDVQWESLEITISDLLTSKKEIDSILGVPFTKNKTDLSSVKSSTMQRGG